MERPDAHPPLNQPRAALARLVAPLDRSLAQLSASASTSATVQRLRWFWLDSLFANISANFYGPFVPLFALAYGASNAQVGLLTGVSSLCALLALLPGAQAIQWVGGQRRKALVVWFGGLIPRNLLLVWLLMPFLLRDTGAALTVIIAVNALMTFAGNFANPAWTAIIADIVPANIRGRYFSHRNYAVNVPALLVVPLAGYLIELGNHPGAPFGGYQLVFLLALLTGSVATFSFAQLDDPVAAEAGPRRLPFSELVRIIRTAPSFLGLLGATLLWNLGMQLTAPFLNLYLVHGLGADTAMVGWVAAAASVSALLTQRWVGGVIDRRGNLWVQGVTSFLIVLLPLGWLFATAAWQVIFVNLVGGVMWAFYNLSTFNLLLELSPEKARAEAAALFQVVIAACATVVPILGGHLADLYGYRPLIAMSATVRVVAACAFVWWVARPAARRARRAAAITES